MTKQTVRGVTGSILGVLSVCLTALRAGATVFYVDMNYVGTETGSETLSSISVDPKFLDRPNHDYHLNGGPCLDAGTDLGVTVDLEDTTRVDFDLGCYEGVAPSGGTLVLLK